MRNEQIIIFIILGFFWLLGYFKLVYNLDENKKQSFEWFALFTIVNSLFIVISIILTLLINDLQEQVKGKCPELEEVKNVYRIK